MKRYYLFFFVAMYVFFSGCNSQSGDNAEGESEFYTIDFEQGFETKQQMLISEIADTVEYLELKTPEDIIITSIRKVIPFEGCLVVKARNRIYLFHRDGQFISSIGNIGQGPGEYITAMDVCIDKKRREIVVSGIEQILHYDFNGNYLRNQLVGIINFDIGTSDTVLWGGQDLYSVNQKYQAVAFSLNGGRDTIAYIPNPAYETVKSNIYNRSIGNSTTKMFYYKNDTLYFQGAEYNNIIWRISGVKTMPHAFIDMGKYKMPGEYESWHSRENYDKYCDKYWGVSSLVEDDNYFFLLAQKRRYTRIPNLKYVVYDKRNKKGFTANDNHSMGLTDDLAGGPPVWPRWASEDYYINAIEAHELLEKVEAGDYSPSPQLEELLSKIGDDTNQLIVLCHKKK
ncbi:MAG: 6-bladed beta-propeller [Tannerella sp.]|jgi:hypothetical protein|nr:6-bladed beta-propeller [Tannerella sp.]